MDNAATVPAAKPRAKSKTKGPIRIEAVGPFAIFVALVVFYFVVFFDYQLRKGMEWGATYANGAEVNIGRLHTSFLGGSFELDDLEVTNAEVPARNKLQLGQIRFQFLWDALLRGKFVVPLAGITGIEVDTVRKSPGYVLPPPPEKPSVLAKVKEQVSRAVLGEAGELLEGLDPTKKIKDLGNLKSAARVRELKTELGQKQTQWTGALASLPGDKDLADLQAKVNAISGGGANPAEIAGKISQVNDLIKQSEAKVTAVKSQGETLAKDVTGFGAQLAGIDELVKQDRADIEKQLKIPELDAKSIAQQLFGPGLLDKVGQAEHYMNLARQYMPAKGAPKPPEPARRQGRNYAFGRPNSYPKFWLQKAEISTKGEHSAAGGDVSGQLVDVTTDPAAIGRAAVLTARGDFAKQELHGIEARIVVDHTKDVATESAQLKIASFPVAEKKISDTDSLKFAFAKAQGSGEMLASLTGDRIDLQLDNVFRKIDYQVAAKSPVLQSMIQGVVKEVPEVDVRAKVSGTWHDLSLSVQSNLASALQSGIARQLEAKLAEARKKIDELINGNIAKEKAELTEKYNGARTQVTAQLDAKRKQAEAVQAQATAKLNAVKSQASSAGKKATDFLKKKLPFGH